MNFIDFILPIPKCPCLCEFMNKIIFLFFIFRATHFSGVWSEWEFYIKRRPQALQPKRPPIRRER